MRKQEIARADAVRLMWGMALVGVIVPAIAFVVGYATSEHGRHASTAAAVAALVVGCVTLMITEEAFTVRSFPWTVGVPAATVSWTMSTAMMFSNGLLWPMCFGGIAAIGLGVLLGVPRTIRIRIAHAVARRHRSAA